MDIILKFQDLECFLISTPIYVHAMTVLAFVVQLWPRNWRTNSEFLILIRFINIWTKSSEFAVAEFWWPFVGRLRDQVNF